jgi:hypothetical protein
MAKLNFQIATTGGVALAAATAKTVLQLNAPTNQRVAVSGIHVSFDGVSGTAVPVLVEVARVTTAGTNTSVTPRKTDDDVATAIQSTAGENATAEPTYGDILKEIHVHPQSGYEVHIPFGKEIVIGGGDRLAIRCTAPAVVNVAAWMECEE